MKNKKRYIGKTPNVSKWNYFESAVIPTEKRYPMFSVVVGPFKTKRAALWAIENPFGYAIVADAEELAKGA